MKSYSSSSILSGNLLLFWVVSFISVFFIFSMYYATSFIMCDQLDNSFLGSKQLRQNIDVSNHENSINIVIGVFSTGRAKDSQWRETLRNTYFKYPNVCPSLANVSTQSSQSSCTVICKFILGKQKDEELMKNIQKENETYGDIILLDIKENMNEGKTYTWWKYASLHYPDAYYIAKSDSDNYIWTELLEKDLMVNHKNKHFVYYGRLSCAGKIGCVGKDRFISGGFQVLSIDLVHWIADPLNDFVIERKNGYEDVITGKWFHDGHRFVRMISPCEDQIEHIYKIYNTETCANIFMHWLKKQEDFLDIWNNQLDKVLERKRSEQKMLEEKAKQKVIGEKKSE